MAETYCGKTCGECLYKEQLECPGCKAGPGRHYASDCKLAKCCRDKGHQECAGCGFQQNCNTLRGKDRAPEYRIKSIEAQKAMQAAIAARAPVLGKWLWILFWMVIPNSIAAIMANQNLAGFVPAIYLAGQILNAACSFVYGFILLRLADEEERYRTAGICTLIGGAVSVLLTFVASGQMPVWMLLLSIPAAIVSFVGMYFEYTAHSEVLTGVDNNLAEKWTMLWKWHIGTLCAMLGGVLVTAIVPILGLLVVLAAGLGGIVVAILRLVYLYRTANIFRNYQSE